jgi:hypothetical protein
MPKYFALKKVDISVCHEQCYMHTTHALAITKKLITEQCTKRRVYEHFYSNAVCLQDYAISNKATAAEWSTCG